MTSTFGTHSSSLQVNFSSSLGPLAPSRKTSFLYRPSTNMKLGKLRVRVSFGSCNLRPVACTTAVQYLNKVWVRLLAQTPGTESVLFTYTFFHGSPNTNDLEHPSKQKKIPKKSCTNTKSSNTKQVDVSPERVFFFHGGVYFFSTVGKTTSVCVKKLFFFFADGKKSKLTRTVVCDQLARKKNRVAEKKNKPTTAFSSVKTVEGFVYAT